MTNICALPTLLGGKHKVILHKGEKHAENPYFKIDVKPNFVNTFVVFSIIQNFCKI
jgi:hypothetical protein